MTTTTMERPAIAAKAVAQLTAPPEPTVIEPPALEWHETTTPAGRKELRTTTLGRRAWLCSEWGYWHWQVWRDDFCACGNVTTREDAIAIAQTHLAMDDRSLNEIFLDKLLAEQRELETKICHISPDIMAPGYQAGFAAGQASVCAKIQCLIDRLPEAAQA